MNGSRAGTSAASNLRSEPDSYVEDVLDGLDEPQCRAILLWLTDHAIEAHALECEDAVASAILYWRAQLVRYAEF